MLLGPALIRANLANPFVQPGSKKRAHAHLNSMKVAFLPLLKGEHFPHMGKIVLDARSRAGKAGKAHGNPREDEGLGHIAHSIQIPCKQLICLGDGSLKRVAHHLGNFGAVVFPCNQVGDAPFADGDIFCKGIAQACLEHAHRRSRHNLCICDDPDRAGAGQAHFYSSHDHGAGGRGKAIHAGRCGDENAALAHGSGQHLAEIVDNAAAHCQNAIAGCVKAHAKLTQRGFIRLWPPLSQHQGLKGNSSIL